MGWQGDGGPRPAPDRGSDPGLEPIGERVLVEDGGSRRPFMRGIMVHSLVARGVPFDDAYRTADAIRTRIEGRGIVSKSELAAAVSEILGPEASRDDPRLPLPIDIAVVGHGRGIPFSKGTLSQSLLAAAIDPHDAFDVAREIERELVRRGVREVARGELRSLAYQTLCRHMGRQTAERYLVWRRYQEPDRPVMILLGGTTGVGKTSLALEVAHRLGIARVLSTDSVRQIMRLMLSSELVPAIHTSAYDAHRAFAPGGLSGDAIIEGFKAQAATVAVGVRASMDRAVAENASLVFDGVSIVPGVVDLERYAELAHVILLVVATLDEEALRGRFTLRAAGQSHRVAHRYLENFAAILRIQDHFLDLAERYGVPIVDNVSFDHSVLQIIRHVTETLRKREPFDVAESV